MLSGATSSAFAMAGTAVFRIVVSSDSMKKATATSHGNNCFSEPPRAAGVSESALELVGITLPPADYLVVPHFQFPIELVSTSKAPSLAPIRPQGCCLSREDSQCRPLLFAVNRGPASAVLCSPAGSTHLR